MIFGDADGYVFLCTRNSDGTLNDMQKLEADGKVIQYAHSSPEIVDWNEDGLLDLVVTGWEDSIYVYLNNGTAQQYTFTDRTIVKANGVPIRHPRNQVCIADLNNDGKKDIIIGTNDDKMGGAQLVFYENSGTNAAPLFTKGVALKSNNAVIANTYPNPILAFEVRLCVTDWNEDGTPDMVVGDNSANTIQIPLRYAGVFLGKSLTGNKISAVSKNDFFIKFTRFSSAGALEINCSRAGIFSIKLYAVNGKRIIYGNYYIEKGTSYIRLEGNAPCNETYLVEITGKNQKSIKQKIILSH